MARYRASITMRVRVNPRTRRAWSEWVLLEAAISGRTVSQALGRLLQVRRQTLLVLAKRRGLDPESILNSKGKPVEPKPMPIIDRPSPDV